MDLWVRSLDDVRGYALAVGRLGSEESDLSNFLNAPATMTTLLWSKG
jgi:hypothetical protein